jgi:trans-aconitate methyltransferase
MSQFHFTPEHYLELMHSEVPAFDEFQERVAAATVGLTVNRILELGTGTGETARHVLERHPAARLTGIDMSAEMLARAQETLPSARIADLLVQGIQDDLPEGPFDLVISALTSTISMVRPRRIYSVAWSPFSGPAVASSWGTSLYRTIPRPR